MKRVLQLILLVMNERWRSHTSPGAPPPTPEPPEGPALDFSKPSNSQYFPFFFK